MTELSDVKRKLLARLAAGSAGPSPAKVRKRSGTGPVRLSYAQERVWLMDRLAGDLPLFNLVIAGRLRMAVDHAELRRRLGEIVARHDALRMTVTEIDGVPYMRIAEQVPVGIPLVELPDERLAYERAYATGMRPYRLDTGPLWRVELVKLGAEDHVMVIAAHHIAVDGLSLTLILRELAGLEAAPELPVGYADFAVWQRELLEQGGADRDLAYWRERLAGVEALELPTDRQRPARPTFAGRSLQVLLDSEQVRRLGEIGRRSGATPYMTVFGVFFILLHRYTGVRDLAMGSLVSGRTEPELQHLIGMFANMVVVRVDLGGDPDFVEVLDRVRRSLIGAIKHQNVPFEHLVKQDRQGRQVRIAYNMPAEAGALPRIGETVPLDITPEGSQLDLTLHMIEESGTVRLTFEYSTDLFDEETITRLAGHFGELLTEITADPTRPISSLTLTTPDESWENGPETGPRELLPERVAEQVRRTPDALAVVGGGRRLTYAQLAADAESLACHLQSLGVGAETPVGVCLRRGQELPAVLLGIWRAGGVYVPLDPDHPRERLAALLADTRIEVIVTSRDLAGRLPSGRLVFPEEPHPCGELEPTVVRPENAAYVMYTSGSTGRPKGVVVTHAGIANRVEWTVGRHGFRAGDRVLQKTPLTFDAAGWEFFAPLISGGTVVLAPEGSERDPAALVRAVGDYRVSVLQVVPALLRQLVGEKGWERCGALRLLFCAGEPLHGDLCAQVRAVTDARLCNTYGPTECAIDVTFHETTDEQGPIPIGTPLDNLRILILRDGRRVPVGVPGELHVGGVALARGYAQRPGLTADRFVPDPFLYGERLYRTGDLARWTRHGTLEYLGRTDAQLKINGVRVEPAEVEAALTVHPAISAAAVTARGHRLVAHVTTRTPITPGRIRDDLRTRLPAALIPSVVVEVPSLPVTTSGKLDRRAVAALPLTETTTHVPLRGPTERAVAQVWQDLLDTRAEIGAEDDFFALGGHSLLIATLAARLRAATGHDLDLADLFSATTVRAQAGLLDGPTRSALPPLTPRHPDEPIPLSFGQRRLWFLDRLSPGSPEYLVPLIVPLKGDARESLRGLARRHAVLRTRYPALDGEPRAVLDDEGPIDLSEAVAVSAEHVIDLVRAELERSFDLATGPVWRALRIRVPQADDLLVITIHHIACDARSLRILAEDLRDPAREPGTIGYADFAHWQRRSLSGERLPRLAGFWREQLAGVQAVELPTDRVRPALRDPAGGLFGFEVPGADLLARGREAGATPFMTVFAVFCAFLARHTGQGDLAVGVPVDGRDRPELDEVVGFFVNTLILRVDLGDRPDFAALLARVRKVTLDAFAHRDLPFERLVDELRPERDLSRTPIVNVLFDLQTGEDPGVIADDEALSAWQTAKTDLSLLVRLRHDGTLSCRFEYATALFDRDTVERFATRFASLVRTCTADVLEPAERALLTEWGTGDAVPEPACSLHDLVTAQARITPDVLAVVSGTEHLTYRALHDRTARLADRLDRAGVRRGDVVGVCLERGPDLVTALLAVLGAGAAYLPLDPDDPPARHTWQLDDSGATMVIGPSGPRHRRSAEVPEIPQNQLPELAARDLAYVIYTSGSTGTPKGVMVEHAAIVNRIRWMQRAYGLQPGDRVLQKTPVTFDVSLWEFFWPLTTGATLVMAPPGLHRDARGLAAFAEAESITHLHFVPSMLDTFLEVGARLPNSVRDVFCSGEALGAATVRRLREGSGARLHNLYGPTELAVDVTYHEAGEGEPVPIGVPIDNMRVLVVDGDGAQVPIGVPGELLAGGTGTARGYVNRPGLTAERFVPDPERPGERLYRTGDLVKWNAAGKLLYLGRTDDQVKIRGIRVEPGEVAAVMASHPQVGAAVVVAGDNVLTGYYVAGEVVPDLAAHCAERLPAALVPGRWVRLDALPTGPNGKLDRRSLPSPAAGPAAGERLPGTAAEKRIAGIWAELLGLEPGAEQDFFTLGGHSLLAVLVQHRLIEEFDVDLPLRVLFEATTVAGLAGAVEAELAAQIAGLSDAEVALLLSGADDDA